MDALAVDQDVHKVLKLCSSILENEIVREKLFKIFQPVFHKTKQIFDENSETIFKKLTQDPVLNVFVLMPLKKI